MISKVDESRLTDEQLLQAVKDMGDIKAFQQLFERYSSTVMGLAYKLVGDHALAEEITQETFWRVWRNATSYNSERALFATWMFGIARNLCIDNLRKHGRVYLQSLSEDDDHNDAHTVSINQVKALQDAADSTAELTNTLIKHEHVHLALAELPSDQRDVIEWVYFQGKTRREIAQEQEIPFGTINTRARLALQKLKVALQDRGFELE